MGKFSKTFLIFFMILIQSTAAVAAGIFAITYEARDYFHAETYIGGLNVGNIKKSDAREKIKEYYDTFFKDKNLSIIIDGKDEYVIPYKDFGVKINEASTLDRAIEKTSSVIGLIGSYFGNDKTQVQPVISFNEGLLRQKLIELSKKIDIEPQNASVSIVNGDLYKKAETVGLRLIIENAVQSINNKIKTDFNSTVLFYKKDNFELQTVNPEIMLREYSDIEQVVSEYYTEINDDELLDSIKHGVSAINGTILSGSKKDADEGEMFSFIESLSKADADFENDNEGYDQVASTLYAAILEAGIEKDSITRLPHKLAPGYICAGLDAWISGNGGDLKFVNTTGNDLVVFASVEDNKLFIRLAGKLSDTVDKVNVKVETIQKSEPSIVYIENKELKKGEKVLISEGKEGLMVKVFRNNELISTDTYEAEKSIIQVGPGTDWPKESENSK